MTCSCPSFVQSRALSHLVSEKWSNALFALLHDRPVDALYSIAFSLSFTPTFGVQQQKESDDEAAVAHYTASRELFDLLDDCIRDTDSLNVSALLRTRLAPIEGFAQANEDYRMRTRPLASFVERYDVFGLEPEVETRTTITSEDRADMLHTFERLNNEVAGIMPLVVSADGSETIDTFDVKAFTHASSDDLLRGSVAGNGGRGGGAWSTARVYIYYSYILARYDSLRPVAHQIETSRDVHILPLLIPLGCVWQVGLSQMLWILLHSLAALSVSRRNQYINRLLVLLRNVSFFIWCGQCAVHWRTNGGDAYFDLFRGLDAHDLTRLPVDIILMRCHNAISTNIHPNRRLSTWTLAQLVSDYREFVERRVLRRRPAVCNRVDCPCERGGGDSSGEDLSSSSSNSMRPLYVTTDTRDLSAEDLLRLSRGDWLIFRLWVAVDSKKVTLRAS